jgi:hypothetical protein
MGNKNSLIEAAYEKVPQTTPRASVALETPTKTIESRKVCSVEKQTKELVSEPVKKCDICKNECLSDKTSLYKLFYKFGGVCKSCDIVRGRSLQTVSARDYNIDKKCDICKNLKKCNRATIYEPMVACGKCYLHYMSQIQEKDYCFCTKNTNCSIKDCGKVLDNNSGVYYDDKSEKYICIYCFLIHRGTRKDIARSMTNVLTGNIPATTTNSESNIVSYLVPDSKLSATIYINHFSPEYVNEWSCVEKECNHPTCHYCNVKHSFLCKINVCNTRIDMCSQCWTKFNNMENNNETKKE